MIGDKIRELRKARKLTQEQLADYLNISSQAVSKWETGMSNPDLDMLTRLAVFFRTTPDALLDYDVQRVDAEINALVDQCCPYGEDSEKVEAFYREALKKYPNNDRLLNCLLIAIPDSRSKEKIEIGERLLDTSTDGATRLEVLRQLALTCYCAGDQAMAENYLRRLPELSFLKTEVAAVILKGEAQKQEIEKTENICLTTLCAMLLLRQRQAENDEERRRISRLTDELLALFAREPAFRALSEGLAEDLQTGNYLSYFR